MIKTERRHQMWHKLKKKNRPRMPLGLSPDHPAITEARTLFPSRIVNDSLRVLKEGKNSRKIGSHVTKGHWRGMSIFTLTLEERATCPTYCHHWKDCYGNNMHWAHRQQAGVFLEDQLERELKVLQFENPKGFVVRLHVLGDFYNRSYIKLWYKWMLDLPALHVFGFTALRPDSELGALILKIRNTIPKRWWIRFSHADNLTWLSTGPSGITCPMQTGKTDCCGTCGLCWTARKPIHFLTH